MRRELTFRIRLACYAVSVLPAASGIRRLVLNILDGSAFRDAMSSEPSVLAFIANLCLSLSGLAALLFLGQCAAWAICRIKYNRPMPKPDTIMTRRAWTVYGVIAGLFLGSVVIRNAGLCGDFFSNIDTPAGPLVVFMIGPVLLVLALVSTGASVAICVIGAFLLYLFRRMGVQMDMLADDTDD